MMKSSRVTLVAVLAATLLFIDRATRSTKPETIYVPIPVEVKVPVPVPVPVITQQAAVGLPPPVVAVVPPTTPVAECPGDDPKAYVARTPNPFFLCTHGVRDMVSDSFIKNGYWYDCPPLQNVLDTIRKVLHMPTGAMLEVAEVGGNIGSCSWVMATNGANVTAFEPVFKNYDVFRRSNELNLARYGPRVTVHNKGCGSTVHTAVIRSEKGNMGNSIISTDQQNDATMTKLLEGRRTTWDEHHIQITTLDTEIHRHIHFMKMDCQGHEIEALLGGRNLLRTHGVDIIKAEYFTDFLEASGHKAREMLDILDDHGYVVLLNGREIPPSTFERFQYNKKTDIYAVKRGLIDPSEYRNLH